MEHFAKIVNCLKPLNYFLEKPLLMFDKVLNRFSSSVNKSNQSKINSFIEAVVWMFSIKTVLKNTQNLQENKA